MEAVKSKFGSDSSTSGVIPQLGKLISNFSGSPSTSAVDLTLILQLIR